MSAGTIDAVGNIHDQKGQFAGHIQAEQDADSILGGHAVPLGHYSDIKDQKARVAAMRDDLEAAVNDIVESGQLQSWLDARVLSRQRHWSFCNQLLSELQYHGIRADQDEETRAEFPESMMMSKTAWARLGRSINEGTRAIWIRRPCNRKGTRINDKGEEEDYYYTGGFAPQAEYDISQTHGEPVEGYGVMHPKMLTGDLAAEAVPGLAARIMETGYSVVEEKIPGFDPAAGTGTFGYTDPATKRVVIDPRTPPATRLNVYAHELAHIKLGHVDSMLEYRSHRGRMETEAEAAAYMVVRGLGGDHAGSDAFSAPYIAGWASRESGRDVITRSLDRAAKAANEILDGDW